MYKRQILGRHKGITHYTVGQRKGLGIALGYPVFVTEIRPETNEVVLGSNEDVFTTELYADHVNFMSIPDIEVHMIRIQFCRKHIQMCIRDRSQSV